ncbi:hypothetical protein D3C72_1367360 [compost metagenome]
MQIIGQQRAQALLNTQAILQQHHFAIAGSGLGDNGRHVDIAGGFGTHQQPVTGRHVGDIGIRLHGHLQRSVYGALDPYAMFIDGVKLATQEKMHVESRSGQHHAVKAANGAGADDANSWTASVHSALLKR